MSVLSLLIAAAGAVATPNTEAAALACNLALPGGSQFRLDGHFDDNGLHSNLSDLIQVEGVLSPTAPEPLIITDGTTHHRWSLDGGSQKFDASLTQYGSEAAVLILERRRFVGRHWGRGLVGVGFCELRRGQAGRKAS